ncbi:MAG TPA: oligoribonuclease [Candidatus Saccharimonadales bacterium]|jgi:oligoribonuclease|nr:oligoribonuclease [Candidatus Saccharimonadales bacterium]
MDIRKVTPTKILWVDLEMTGLDSERDVIIEIAAEVTDFNFKTLASYEAIVQQSDEALEAMVEWPKAQHAASGLTERVRTQGRPEEEVKHELIGFIKAQFGDESAILGGNSIHNDRLFIKKWWPEVDALLHYRMLDVTSFKIFMQGRYGVEYEKKDAHRAFDDIQASIAELQFYLERLKNPPGAEN